MPLTTKVAKAMIEVNGLPLISHSLKQLKKVIPYVSITVGYRGAELAKHVIEQGVATVFNTSGRGNAWWIFNTFMKYINEPVLVLTCDNIVKLEVNSILSEYRHLDLPPCMVVPVSPVEGIEGDYIFGENGIVRMLSRKEPTEMYCSGIQVINPFAINNLMKACEDFNEVWENLIQQHQLYYSAVYPNKWYAVNTLEQLDFISEKI